jgi:hypothetical protein
MLGHNTIKFTNHRPRIKLSTHLGQQLAAIQKVVCGAHVDQDVVECTLRIGDYVGHEFSCVVLCPFAGVAQVTYTLQGRVSMRQNNAACCWMVYNFFYRAQLQCTAITSGGLEPATLVQVLTACSTTHHLKESLYLPLKALVPQGQLLGLQIGENADTLLANS